MKKIVFTFGRYNPPTTGHAELIMYAVKLARSKGADHRIYTSQSHDPSKNPLAPRQKMAFLRQIFPGVNFVDDPNMKTAFAIAKKLADEGYEDVTFVVGDDRVREFTVQLGKYVKPRTDKDFDPKKHYPFKHFKVVSSGARKKGISGTDLRAAVRKGDFATFAKASAAKDKSLAREIFAATRSQLKEEYLSEEMTRKDFDGHLKSFIDFTCDKLGIKEKPTLRYKEPHDQGEQPSFAAYSPSSREVFVMTKNRHPMDVFRSVAHELVHHKQNEDGRIGNDTKKEGATGSDIENEANARAGELMRWYGKANPQCFSMSYVTEEKAIILAGTPGSGKDKILKEAILPHGFTEVSTDTFNINMVEGNIVVNGSANYERIRYIKEQFEGAGYNTIMVFVNTSNEVSRQRNEARNSTGGRVINEAVRYTKWKAAQDNLAKYDQLFEKVIEVKNDLNLNENVDIIKETYEKLIKSVSKEIGEFALNEADRRFEIMLNEVGGAGNWGTTKLTDRYKADTPGQEPGKMRTMGYYEPPVVKEKTKVKVFGNLPKFGDRIGPTFTSAKNPSFVGDITSDQNVFMPGEPISKWSPVDRWMMKEETRRRFKAKYGKLAEEKMRETAEKVRKESLVDPYMGSMGATPNSMVQDVVKPDINAEFEKLSIFKKVKAKNKLNSKN
jgi:hypothetical protein